jgi:hypothetical protein
MPRNRTAPHPLPSLRPRRRSRSAWRACPTLAALAALAIAADALASRIVTSAPGRIVVELTPGDPITVPIEVGVGSFAETPLDAYFLVDASQSFASGLERLRAEAPGVVWGLAFSSADTRFGVGSFADKPAAPFGDPGDHVYAMHSPLDADGDVFRAALDAPAPCAGGDPLDAQIEALFQAAVRADSDVGFRPEARRLVILATDSAPHGEQDALSLGFPPNDGDEWLDGSPPGAGEAYPGFDLLRETLVIHRVLPLFAVARGELPTYQALVDALGFGAVGSLGAGGAHHLAAIGAGLVGMRHVIRPEIEDDFLGVVRGLEPYEHDHVANGETRRFDLALRWSGGGDGRPVGPILFRTPYGVTEIEVLPVRDLPECSDGIDNDGDGGIDLLGDLHCLSRRGTERPECSDGIDNDGDGLVDWPDDGSCASDGSDAVAWENTGCTDGIDNDGDGHTDWPEDPECGDPARFNEASEYCGLIGIEALAAWPLAGALRRLRRSRTSV